jgi:hypothetical protein
MPASIGPIRAGAEFATRAPACTLARSTPRG